MRGTRTTSLSRAWFDVVARMVGSKLARTRLRQKTYPALVKQYSHIRLGDDWRRKSVHGLENESGVLMGWVVDLVQQLSPPPRNILLAGEAASAKQVYSDISGVPVDKISTAGLHDDADHRWNFEQAPPAGIGDHDCIVSYAILEHLLDPYRHLTDLAGLLSPDGSLIVYTVSPGFPYHRHPVDCLRFFPDWFEEAAKRLKLSVGECYMGEDHIVYCFRKPTGPAA